jgi:hypothetical protein
MFTYQVSVSLTGELIAVVTDIRATNALQAIAQVEEKYRQCNAQMIENKIAKVVLWTGHEFQARLDPV